MKTELLLIRHGQSMANVQRFFGGHLDSPLTDFGIQQAQVTAKYIYEHYAVDRVYASDLSRAYETGRIIADLYGLQVSSDARLREIFAGQWESVLYDLLPVQFPQSYSVWLHDIGNAVCDGGEAVAHLQKRVLDALRYIGSANLGKTVVVTTHATPIRALQCHCQGKSLDQMKDIKWVSNASVSAFTYEEGQFMEKYISYDAHLGQLKSVLPRNC